jgi:V8-like Glu-specific endopeptidase
MKSILVLLVISFFSGANCHAVIFGQDDRDEVRNDPFMQKLSLATATQVATSYVEFDANGRLSLNFQALTDSDNWNMCADERFANQPSSPIACTAFLVAPDLLITAGHCAVNWRKVQNEFTPQCEAFAWLFDYQTDENGNVQTTSVSPTKLVHCKKVIYANQDVAFDKATQHNTYHEDIALIQIDRAVTDREPLKLAQVEATIGDHLSAIGYPLGLPAKSVKNGNVFDVSDPDYIRTDLDVSGGNSGSPVFNTNGEVVGVVVRAFPDPETTTAPIYSGDGLPRTCERWLRCSPDRQNCGASETSYVHATEVQRIKAIFPYLK